MDIGEVLSKAWRIIWKHKVLWIFGILAGCTAGRNGPNPGYQFQRNDFNWNIPPEFRPFDFNFSNLPEWLMILLVVIGVALILLLVLLVIFFGTVGQAGLARGTYLADQGIGRLSFGELFGEGMTYFWRIFAMNLLLALISIGLLLIGIPLGFVTCGLGWLLSMLVLWMVQIVQEQAVAAIVVENLGAMDGLRRGWQVVRANLGRMIVMGLILLLGVSLIGGLIIVAPLLAVVVPAFIIPVAAAQGSEPVWGGALLTIAVCVLAYLPILLVLGGILRSFVGSAWTLTFLRLTGRTEGSVNPVLVQQ